VAGTVARLFPNKGYEELIAMLPLVLRETPELRFVWVGGGPEQPRYAGALRDAGVLDRVRFTGLVAPDDIPAIMNGFDLLVHTSRWEGLPRAAVQALLTNIPVVSFDIDGVPEVVVHGKTGRLVPLGDIDGLTKTVAELARSPVLRQNYGHNGRILCLERFDHRRMVEQIEALYARLKR
jgi:glycosyltransferase involved in cell wall biosynthesis